MKTRKGYRKIVVDCIHWQYHITSQNVIAYSEFDKKLVISINNFIKLKPSVSERMNSTQFEIEEGNINFGLQIKPNDIEEWIHNNS
jgi:hypothetical protein